MTDGGFMPIHEASNRVIDHPVTEQAEPAVEGT